MAAGFRLYFSLHVDASDGKSALLVKCDCSVILGIYSKLQIGAAKSFCQSANFIHHTGTDPPVTAAFVYADLVNNHDLALYNTGPVIIADFQESVSDNGAAELCNIQFPIPDRIRITAFGV